MLEVTETVAMDDVEEKIQRFLQLKSMGLLISLDDFGTGYSSLAYLKRLPIDELKIDRSFVMDIESDPDAAVFVDTIISMSTHLGIEVIAEGVETEQQLMFLSERGCKRYQGYYFSKPVSLEKLRELFQVPSRLKTGSGNQGNVVL
jgi:EAL domain-containing protein (putative c-di-GMP-specific phosphodiesterase class I)